MNTERKKRGRMTENTKLKRYTKAFHAEHNTICLVNKNDYDS